MLNGPSAPVNVKELVGAVVKTWAYNPVECKKAVESVRKFLDFCVEDLHMPTASWTLTNRAARELRSPALELREEACPTDAEILHQMDSLADTLPATAGGMPSH